MTPLLQLSLHAFQAQANAIHELLAGGLGGAAVLHNQYNPLFEA